MNSFFNYLNLPLSLLGITAIEAMGLQLILGGAGLLTLGHTAFFAIGGYSSAAFVTLIAPRLGIQNGAILLILGMLFAAFCSTVCAALVSIPCLRLRGDYLAVATMGLGQITENVFNNIPQFGGASGFTNVPQIASLWGIWMIVFAVGIFLTRFYKTGVGHSILCSRDDEVVARCFGISPERAKFTAFLVGNLVTGLAGALYVHTFQFISPVSAGFQKSVEILLAVVIGGMFSLWGSLLGAVILVLIPELLRFVPRGIAETGFGQNSTLIFSLVVLIILKLNPSGVISIFSSLFHLSRKHNRVAAT